MWNKIKLGLYRYVVRLYNFLPDIGTKLFYSLISIKVWCLFSLFIVATWLLINKFLTGTEYAGLIGTVWSAILAVREIYRTTETKNLDGTVSIKKEEEANDLTEEDSAQEAIKKITNDPKMKQLVMDHVHQAMNLPTDTTSPVTKQ